MKRNKLLALALSFSLALAAAGCGDKTNTTISDTSVESSVSTVTSVEDKPETSVEAVPEIVEKTWMDSSLPVEQRVELLLSVMTLEEKAFQMVQAEQAQISASQITSTSIGSVLSGGGSAPSTGNTAADWNKYVNSLKEAALNSRLGIPLLYGVDAVHGHNNVYGATVFPHNIGLGAAYDPELMAEIARVTAEEVKATAIQWDFSPCLGNPQDLTWGRTYECFSQDATEIAALSNPYIASLQENGIIACAKHFIGEGYTTDGVNQGDVNMSFEDFDALLASGVLDPYTGAINEGVLTVMPSYNSINGLKCHGNYHLLTEVLKNQLGFKGFVISDYNAIEQLQGNAKQQVADSINAGVDMLMQPNNWESIAKYIVELTKAGTITEERIDDAVSRILYVKFTAGLFEEEINSAEQQALLDNFGSEEHREVARRAVRESLVLLKNDSVNGKSALETLKESSFITLEGQAAFDMGRQCGGWTISWQGQSGKIDPGTTIIEGIYNAAKDYASIKHSVDGSFAEETDAVIAVFGEVPYAESDGDRKETVNIAATDMKMLDALKENLENSDAVSVAIIIAGRPVDISAYEDMFDAIVMAWLPGTEGEGIADVLLGDYNFTGTLKYDWNEKYTYGYGLTK